MAYEYRVPGLRFDLAGKAISDALFREAQLEARRQINFQNEIDKEYRLYNGKVRKQDSAIFDAAFQEYQDAAKVYQNSNRRGGKKMQEISRQFSEKRQAVRDIIEDSAKWGAQGLNLEKARKDSKNFVDQDKYTNFMNDLYTMNRNELNAKYSGIENAPKLSDFEWKPENVKPADLVRINTYVKGRNQITPGNTLKVIPSMDEKGMQKEREMVLNFGDEQLAVKVPLRTIAVGPNPLGILQAVSEFSEIPSVNTLFKGSFDRVLKDAANPQNPGQQEIAIKNLDKTSQLFNVTRDQITPQMYYASTYIDPEMNGTIEVEDWDTLNKRIGVIAKDLAIKGKKVDIAKAIEDLKQSTSPIDQLNKMLTVLGKVEATGAMNQDDMSNTVKNVFKSLGWNITDQTFDQLWKGSFQSKLGRRTGGFELLTPEER
jgi:hypothetical protein